MCRPRNFCATINQHSSLKKQPNPSIALLWQLTVNKTIRLSIKVNQDFMTPIEIEGRKKNTAWPKVGADIYDGKYIN